VYTYSISILNTHINVFNAIIIRLVVCKKERKKMAFLEKVSNVISKYMAVLVIIVAGVALFEPISFKWAVPHITLLLGIVMFGMGMTLKLEDFKVVFSRPRDVLIGCLAQFTIMPGLAWLLAKGFGLPPELAVGVILVGTCPGGTSSNVMTYLAKGDVALSVGITTVTTLLAPFVTPLLTWALAGQWLEISLVAMMVSIVKVVLVPIFLGIIANKFFASFVQNAVKVLPLVSVIAIVLIVGGVVSVSAKRILETGALVMLVVVCHNMLGYLLGYLIGKVANLEISKTKAIAIEVGMQNSGLATTLAIKHFTPEAAIPGAIFSVWHNISGSIVANVLSGKTDTAEDKLEVAESK
jgi:BASS family bile acid:Na+ symporter